MQVYEWYQCVQEGKWRGPVFRYLEGAISQAAALLCAAPGVLSVGLPPVLIHGGSRTDVCDDGDLEFLVDAVPLFRMRLNHSGKFELTLEFDPYGTEDR